MLAKKTDPKDGSFEETKQQIKNIFIDKTKMEGELQLKLTTMQAPNQQMAQQIALIERTKMIDTLYLKYNMRLNYLLAAAERHNLGQDEDIKTLENSYRLQFNQRNQALQNQLTLSPEEENICKNNLKNLPT